MFLLVLINKGNNVSWLPLPMLTRPDQSAGRAVSPPPADQLQQQSRFLHPALLRKQEPRLARLLAPNLHQGGESQEHHQLHHTRSGECGHSLKSVGDQWLLLALLVTGSLWLLVFCDHDPVVFKVSAAVVLTPVAAMVALVFFVVWFHCRWILMQLLWWAAVFCWLYILWNILSNIIGRLQSRVCPAC